jgi:type IVB pilus formation R64 PilN family outer membrane protein
MLFKKIIILSISFFLFTLMGCQGEKVYNQTEANVADVVLKTQNVRHKADALGKCNNTLTVNPGLYVDKTPISIAREPVWLKNHIVIRGDALPFSYYSRTIVNGGGRYVLTHYQAELGQNVRVSLNYSGSVKGALDLLAAKSGYTYTVSGNNIYWQAFVTKTYDVAFMPGSSDYLMGKASGSTGGAAASSASGSGGQAVSAIIDDSAASQYSNMKGTLSVWRDLEAGIKQLLSPDGKVMVSESTTTVTVRDRLTNVNLIGKFIRNLNNNLAKQVLVKVQVLDVRLSSDYVFGINWTIVQRMFGGGNVIFNSQQGTPVSITALGANGALPTFGFRPDANSTTGYTALLNALTQQGKVSVVSEPRVVCLNNQVSAIRIVNQEGYLASVQNTTVGGATVGGSTVTSQLTPGTVVTGLTLYILPKIIGNKIIMQVNADLSVNNGTTAISSQTGTAQPGTNSAPGSFIQVPNVTQKQFNQRGIIGSGDTLILAGFRSVQNVANATQSMDSQALGGKGSTQTNIETIVLITPVILNGTA